MSSPSPSLWTRFKSIFRKDDYTVRPLFLGFRSNTLFIIATVGIGLFTDLFLYGLVVPILPYLLRDRIKVPDDEIQAHVSGLLAAYAGASVLLSPVAGYIADRTSSRQIPFVGGLSALIASTVLLFTGQTVAVLTIARLAQGASCAFVWTVGLALCMDTVGPENLGKTIGSIFSFISVGELFAPSVGGALYQKSGMLAVLALSVAILVVDLIMRLFVIEKRVAARYPANPPQEQHSDSSNSGEGLNESADGQDPNQHENDEYSPLMGKKDISDDFYIPHDQPKWIQKFPLAYCLKSPSLLVAFATAMVQAILLGAYDATVPTHALDVYGFSSLESGLLFIPTGVVNIALGPIAGWAVDRYGTKPVAVIGFLWLTPALALLRIPQAHPYSSQLALYCVFLGLNGAGLALIGSPALVEAGAVVDKFHKRNEEFFGEQGPYASLYAMNSMLFSLGLTVGPEISGGLIDIIGYGNMNAVLAAIAFITAIASFIWLGGPPKMLQKWRKTQL